MLRLAVPPMKGMSRDREGEGKAVRDRALKKWLAPVGEEPGQKGFLGLETSRKYEGERSAASGPGAGALTSASLKPAGHTSVTSVNEDAEGSKPRTLASCWSVFIKWEGEMWASSGVLICARRQTQGHTEYHLRPAERALLWSLPLLAPCLRQRSPRLWSLVFQSSYSKCPLLIRVGFRDVVALSRVSALPGRLLLSIWKERHQLA